MPSSLLFNLIFFGFILLANAFYKLDEGCTKKGLEKEVEWTEEIDENGKKVHKNVKINHKFWTVECGIEGKDEINFILLGDIGGYEYSVKEKDHTKIIGHIATPGQWQVAKGIQKYVQKQNKEKEGHSDPHHNQHFELDFVLNLGDNFYDSGICENDREKRFKEIFMKVYIESNHLAIPFYSIAGNNDYKVPEEKEILNQKGKSEAENRKELFKEARKRAKAQIGYELNGHKNIWNFPAEQFIVHYQLLQKHGKLVNVIFVMIDTLLLCGSSRKDFRRTENSDEKESLRKESLEWLKGMLTFVDENWKPNYLFVLGHYPLYVTKGDRSFKCAGELQELFIKFKVTAYIAGHEHNLKYIKPINGKIKKIIKENKEEKEEEIGPMIHQIVSGGGSRLEDCMDEKHVDYMRGNIEECYPKGVQKEGHHKEEEDEREKKKMKEDEEEKNKEGKDERKNKGKMKEKATVDGKKNKEDEKDEEDDGTVFDGGAFIAVKITEQNATFEFIASGKEYPIENVAEERKEWKKKVKEIFENKEEKRKEIEKEMMEKDFGNPKVLRQIKLKPIEWDKKH